MGELKKWLKQKWVRIGTDGSILGPCGTSKNKKNPDRCLPLKKAKSFLLRKNFLQSNFCFTKGLLFIYLFV